MFDTIIRNGRIVTAAEILPKGLDIGIKDDKIAYIGLPLGNDADAKIFDAEGAYITPGGIDSHVHIEQGNHSQGDTWETGSRSAIAGGNTTVLGFASQERHETSLWPILDEYHGKARDNAYCDYGFHVILTNPTKQILDEELELLVTREGITSVKLYMTYDPLKLTDAELLDVMMTTRSHGMTTMVHAENHDMIAMIIDRLTARSNLDPHFHAVARPQLAETEATYRLIALSELVDSAPVLVVHMSSPAAIHHVRQAQDRQLPIYAETCPHYALLRSKELSKPGDRGFEGSKWVCSPPLRHAEEDLEGVWRGLDNGTFTVWSSDHCPDFYDHPCGKKAGMGDGKEGHCFPKIPNGLPGVETRLPLLFSKAGELAGRVTGTDNGDDDENSSNISLPRFVELTSTNPAKLYGLDHCKGSLVPGLDADIVVWYPKGHKFREGEGERGSQLTITNEMLHHRVDFTPFEGHKVDNWPRWVFLRGKLAWDREGEGIVGPKGEGKFVKRGKSSLGTRRKMRDAPGMGAGERNFWM